MLSIYSSGTGTGTEEDPFGPLSDNSSRLSLSRDQGNSLSSPASPRDTRSSLPSDRLASPNSAWDFSEFAAVVK